MADRQDNSKQQSYIDTRPTPTYIGLDRKSIPELKPEGTYTMALNAKTNTVDGKYGIIQNEKGNRICGHLQGENAREVGSILLQNNVLLKFVVYKESFTRDGFLYPPHAALLYQHPDCTIEVILRTDCLDIVSTDIVTGEFKIHNGCDTIIYFTNKRSKLKCINLSKLERYLLEGRNLENANIYINNKFGWDCGLFNLHPDMNFPSVNLESIGSSGNIPVGSYYFTIRYLDNDLTPYTFTGLNGPVIVTPNPRATSSFVTTGGIIVREDVQDGKVYANKNINLIISNLDTRYPFFQLGILGSNQGTDTFNEAFVTTPFSIFGDTERITITDLTVVRDILPISNEEITNDFEHIYTVQSLTQIQNRLILGNLSGAVRDWSVFQKKANNIKTMYYTSSAVKSEINDCIIPIETYANQSKWENQDFTLPEFLFGNKTEMRDEVYALGIVWTFKNGDVSPVFHIPGRPALGQENSILPDGRYTVNQLELPFDVPITSQEARNRWYLDPSDNYAHSLGVNPNGLGFFDSYNININEDWDRKNLYLRPQEFKQAYAVTDSRDSSTFTLNDSVQRDPATVDKTTEKEELYTTSFNTTYIPPEENIYSTRFLDCNDTEGSLERWEHVNTSIKYHMSNAPLIFPTSPLASFKEFARNHEDGIEIYSAGLCGYYEVTAQYPPIKDCDGNYIFPHSIDENNNVVMHRIRHHRLPDARKEKFFEVRRGLGADSNNNPKDWDNEFNLYPANFYCYNIEPPQEYIDDLQGYYIVVADRSGNKTVIDKGWLNVCDVSYYYRYEPARGFGIELLGEAFNIIHQNPVYMFPTDKYPTVDNYGNSPLSGAPNITDGWLNDNFGNTKRLQQLGGNYVEFWSPKSSFNQLVNLQGSYYKLENTFIGNIINDHFSEFDVLDGRDDDNNSDSWEGSYAWRFRSASRITRAHLPRMTQGNITNYYLLHNIPIISSEYMLYNSEVLGTEGVLLYSKNHQQKIMISKLYQEAFGRYYNYIIPEFVPQPSIFKPLEYRSPLDLHPSIVGTYTLPPNMISRDLFKEAGYTVVGGSGGLDFDVTYNKAIVQFISDSDNPKGEISPHVYYAALKSNIKPYSKLENILYIKHDNRLFDIFKNSTFLKGGDTFIGEQTLNKTYVRDTNGSGDNDGGNGKLASSLLVGFVESEINPHFRHRLSGEIYRSYPHHSVEEVLAKDVNDLFDGLIESIEKEYHYNLDYSSVNRAKIYAPLTDTFDYCSDCSERYPHTYRWSQVNNSSGSLDYYKIFLNNDFNDIPTDTGDIVKLFYKQEQLFIHTQNNLYRINLAAQELETGNDKVSIGSGALGDSPPQKIFDNLSGFGNGGIEFELSAQYCENRYIWADTKRLKVWELTDTPKEISSIGMSDDLERDLVIYLDKQWYELRKEKYPYLNTHDDASVGIMAVYDPMEDRYIITKKDYEFPKAIFDSMKNADVETDIEEGRYYHSSTGFYVGTSVNDEVVLMPVNFETERHVINKSFTLSFSLKYDSWTSYHSYRPNYMCHNNLTFFTSINNSTIANPNNIWEHNRGEYTNFYDRKFDFMIEYIDVGSDTYNSRMWENLAYTSNMYIKNDVTGFEKESLLHTCDRIMVYNNTQSSGVLNVVVKNKIPYYDVYNLTTESKEVSAHRYGNIWKINHLRDYSKDITFDGTTQFMETIATKDWNNLEYRSIFTIDNGNTGYIDQVSNLNYLDYNQDVYGIKKFEDKFLYVRLFFNPPFNFKINFNLKNNNKQIFV